MACLPLNLEGVAFHPVGAGVLRGSGRAGHCYLAAVAQEGNGVGDIRSHDTTAKLNHRPYRAFWDANRLLAEVVVVQCANLHTSTGHSHFDGFTDVLNGAGHWNGHGWHFWSRRWLNGFGSGRLIGLCLCRGGHPLNGFGGGLFNNCRHRLALGLCRGGGFLHLCRSGLIHDSLRRGGFVRFSLCRGSDFFSLCRGSLICEGLCRGSLVELSLRRGGLLSFFLCDGRALSSSLRRGGLVELSLRRGGLVELSLCCCGGFLHLCRSSLVRFSLCRGSLVELSLRRGGLLSFFLCDSRAFGDSLCRGGLVELSLRRGGLLGRSLCRGGLLGFFLHDRRCRFVGLSLCRGGLVHHFLFFFDDFALGHAVVANSSTKQEDGVTAFLEAAALTAGRFDDHRHAISTCWHICHGELNDVDLVHLWVGQHNIVAGDSTRRCAD